MLEGVVESLDLSDGDAINRVVEFVDGKKVTIVRKVCYIIAIYPLKRLSPRRDLNPHNSRSMSLAVTTKGVTHIRVSSRGHILSLLYVADFI